MGSDNEKTGAAASTATPEERARRDRVRLVRRLSKWLTRFDTMARDANKMQRDGVKVPWGWPFDFGTFAANVNGLRRYVTDALQGATEPAPAAAARREDREPWA